jgi:hypothetical protein
MIRLESRFIEQLLARPETGMGYQRVQLELWTGSRQLGVALNADVVVLDSDSTDVRRLSYEVLVQRAAASAGLVRAISVVEPSAKPAMRIAEGSGRKAPPEAKDAPVEKTKAGEVFKRFSAYVNDRRVQPDGSLRPGTYATTEEDARNVKTGSDAVRRYALPDSTPASYVYTSGPNAATSIQRGIVAPAFGQPGGGVEVIFPQGTQPGTTTGPVKIPDR